MARLSLFIIMLIVFTLVMTGGFSVLMAEFNTNYQISDYDSNRTEVYDRLDEIQQNTDEIKNETLDIQSESGITDVLGGFFEAGYNTLKVAVGSFSIFSDMAEEAGDDLNIANADLFKAAIITIVIIAIFLGIIISTVTKREV